MFGKLFQRSKQSVSANTETLEKHWFDSAQLNATFNELQSVVQETTSLANSISTQLESRLHTKELQLTTLLYVLTEAIIIITDHTGRIQEWNTGAEMLFGYTKDDVIGKSIDIIAHNVTDKEAIRAGFDQTERSEKCNIHRIKTVRCNHKDGTEVLTEISVNVFPDSTNNTQGMIAIVRDVTQQHKEQQAREKERLLLNSVLNAVMDVVMVKTPDGKWILANRAAHVLYNFVDESDYTDKTDAEIAHDFPHFADSLEQCTITDMQAWEQRKTVRTEEVVTDELGQRQYFDVMKTPVYTDHNHKEILVVAARNITQLKEKREHILVAHKALNASSDIVCITDKYGCILFANKAFLVKYRFGDLRDVMGKKMSIVKSDLTPNTVHRQMWQTIQTGKTWEGVVTNTDAQGDLVTVESTIIPIIDQALNVSHYICVQKPIDR